jgi:HK97 family phage major capsid protein
MPSFIHTPETNTIPTPPALSVTQCEVRVRTFDEKGRAQYGRPIDTKKEFRSFGEQIDAVMEAGIGRKMDPRLVSLRTATGMGEAIDSDGGFLIQPDFASDLVKRLYNTGEILTRIKRIPISTGANGLKMYVGEEISRATGSRWGGIRVYRTSEGANLAASTMKLRQLELKLKKMAGLLYVTEELRRDATAMEMVILEAFPKEMSFMMEDEIINGTGAGQMLGILNSLALVTVAKETAQGAATIQKENIDKMWSQLYEGGRASAVWLINQDVEPQLDNMQMVIGVGGVPVYMAPGESVETPFARLKGRPVIPVEYCSTLGTVGDIMLVDLSQYLMIDKGGPMGVSSIHVRFLNDEEAFRFTMRNDGQPSWISALAPYKGNKTQSAYVALATR